MIHDVTLNRIAAKLRSAAPPQPAPREQVPELLARLQAELASRGRQA